jgi:hypothetical protein
MIADARRLETGLELRFDFVGAAVASSVAAALDEVRGEDNEAEGEEAVDAAVEHRWGGRSKSCKLSTALSNTRRTTVYYVRVRGWRLI